MYFWSCTNVIPTLALALLLDVRCNTAEAEDHIAAGLGTLRPQRAPPGRSHATAGIWIVPGLLMAQTKFSRLRLATVASWS